MTAPLIAPLIPPRTRPGVREHGRSATPRRLPVAAAPEVPAVPDDVLYGFGRMDSSGRVADRAMTRALGWQPGDRLTLTAAAGVILARRDPCGMVTMPAKPYLVIPAALRRRCGLRVARDRTDEYDATARTALGITLTLSSCRAVPDF